MKLATIRTLRRCNNVSTACSLIVCLSGIDQILGSQHYWVGTAALGVGLTLTWVLAVVVPVAEVPA